MRSYVAAFLVAMVVAALLTPLVRRLGLRLGAVSEPGGRHVHRASIPRLGGIAIAVALCAPVFALFFVDSGVASGFRDASRLAIGTLIGATALCVVGVVDDTRGVRALYKLLAQIAAATVAFGFGFRIEAVELPLIGVLSMGIFALPVTVIWIVGITNAVNLIDGLDGLAAGVVFFAAVTNFVVAYLSGSIFVAALMAAMMGSLVGFLFYNFNPARIFMGDSGSYFLGFILASSSLAGSMQKTSTAVSLLVPVIALGVPIFDTLFSMVRRIIERRSVFSPDRGHIHHRLLDLGVTHRRAVMLLYGVSVVLTAAAIGVSLGRSWEVGVALLAATAVMLGLVRSVGYFEYVLLRSRQKSRFYDAHTERLRRALPGLVATLARAEDEEAVWDELRSVLDGAGFGYFEVLTRTSGKEACVLRWPDEPTSNGRSLVSARFPIGRDAHARATLKFGWRSETEDVTPQCDILLQVVVDNIEAALVRLESVLAPERITASDVPAVEARALLRVRPSRP
ncbi:MAG: undecaprenyl/decaprenyl-phosphate alpha-N-acetylglucosaminyl 1-phosphate transferase [Myxococcales bacterium]|nr:undecaprenyl/decaprenyl-phosphate alpha-N-acetylglucosaminyl 1-phosphate transferase [Myxococcales bacterium]